MSGLKQRKAAKREAPPERVKTSEARQAWLERAAKWAKARIAAQAQLEVPASVRVSIGWPYGQRGTNTLGQCWSDEASGDKTREVFISPVLEDGARIVDVLAHELIHAALPFGAGHGPEFKRVALAIGLEGHMTATVAGAGLALDIGKLLKRIGGFPGAAMSPEGGPTRRGPIAPGKPGGPIILGGPKRQAARLMKAACPACGYTARITRKWLEGAPALVCTNGHEAKALEAG